MLGSNGRKKEKLFRVLRLMMSNQLVFALPCTERTFHVYTGA